MYVESINTYFIENPKCASRSIDTALRKTFDFEDLSVQGHVFFEDALKRIPKNARIIGIVRNPEQRLISSVRMKCEDIAEAKQRLQKVINGLEKAKGVITYHVFGPQSRYVKIHDRCEIFAFEDLKSVFNIINPNLEVLHENKASSPLSHNAIKSLSCFETALKIYEEDFPLYESVMSYA